MRRIVCVLLLASSVPLMAGCVTVKPWERDLHAREDMQPNAL
jgi:hypothetical protein